MSNPLPSVPPTPSVPVPVSSTHSSSVIDRISTWVSDNKAVVYTIAGVAVVVTGAGVAYYLTSDTSKTGTTPKLSKKERRKRKEAERKAAEAAQTSPETTTTTEKAAPVSVETEGELPFIDETTVESLTDEQRAEYAERLKRAGNSAYGDKAYNRAIDLYTKAILCKKDPVFYSNRAACYSALGEWEKVIEDTTTALNLDRLYVKALNRRSNAYEKTKQYRDALEGFTASCIIDGFKNKQSADSVERLLKVVAEEEGHKMMETKELKLPSHTFVGNYLQSFRAKARPSGLEDSVELDEATGKGQLQYGLRSQEKKTGEGYEAARLAFEKAVELGDLGSYEALAYNMRGTFRCLLGKREEAMDDLSKSIELDPAMTQSYIKRASMNLELGNPDQAEEDFDRALEQNSSDPDIYYHRAQLHFIKGEWAEAAKDYQKSIDLDRDFIFSHIQLGVTQYKLGSIASSMSTLKKCVKNFPNVPDVYNYFGELLLDQQKFQEAVEKFDMAIEIEKKNNPMAMNVLPLINKALALFQWKHDFSEAEKLCQKALIIDPECDIAVATMAQLLLQQGKITEALKYFQRAAELGRSEGETVNALSYAEAARTQLRVQENYPELAKTLQDMNPGLQMA